MAEPIAQSVDLNLNDTQFKETLDNQASYFIDNLANFFHGNWGTDREAWVKGTWQHFQTAYPGFAVMVIHKGQDLVSGDHSHYAHTHLEMQQVFGTEGFEVYVIEKGSGIIITNTGDGGYINWCFSGHSNRADKVVTF